MTNTFLQTALLRAKSRSKNKKQNGFTLIELMVVIAIVGILSAVGLPELLKAQDRAKDSVAKQEAVSLGKECSIWFLTGEVGDVPDGGSFTNASVNSDCTEVSTTSESTEGTTYTVTLESGIPDRGDWNEAAAGGST